MFDDTIDHEAWNDSLQERVILISTLFEAMYSYAPARAVSSL